MRPTEEGNSNRDCRMLALAEAGFDFDDGDSSSQTQSGQGDIPSGSSTSAENSPTQGDANRENHRSSRSRSRSHRSHRHCSYHRHRRRQHFKHRDCNFAAAVCSLLAIVMICTGMAEPRWFRIIRGSCNVVTLGISQFFSWGSFERHSSDPDNTSIYPKIVYHMDASVADRTGRDLVNCVNMEAVQVLKVIIVMCFVAALLSLAAFFLDLTGPTSTVLRATRVNAVCSLLTVVCCVVIVGLCYWVSEIVALIQKKTGHSHRVSVQFDISFYLVTAAGAISVVGSACNLLRTQQQPQSESLDRYRLLDDYDGMEPAQLSPDYYAPMLNIPPPPAYTP